MLRHSQPLGHRHHALPADPGVQGAGDDERRLRLVARASPTAACRATTMLAHIAELSAAADVPMNADFEGGYADAPDGRRRERAAVLRHRRVRPLDRGLHGRHGQAALRLRPGGGAREGGARGDRQGRRRRAVHRRAARASSAAGRISTRPSGGSRPTRRPAPTASMRRASPRASRSPPSSRRWRRSRSTS